MAAGSGGHRRTLSRAPPLNPLRAFEAAARHGSFTRAAGELHITQGAVSQSVRALEEHLGHSLFDRTAAGLQLTPASAAYARAVGESFRRITDATADFVASRHTSIVTVRAYTSFLTHWLIPRIPEFQVRNPGIEVRFIAANDRVRVDHENVDLRIRYGHGRWTGLDSVLLCRDELTPVISPTLLSPAAAPYAVASLASFTWLHSSQRRADWQDWRRVADAPDLMPAHEMVVEELSVVYRLAVSGVGVALGNLRYLQEELQSGRLFRPVTPILQRDQGYYLICPAAHPLSEAASTLRTWLCSNPASPDAAAAT